MAQPAAAETHEEEIRLYNKNTIDFPKEKKTGGLRTHEEDHHQNHDAV